MRFLREPIPSPVSTILLELHLPPQRGELITPASLGPPLLPPFSLVGPRSADLRGSRRSQARPPRISTELQARRAISGGGSSGGGDSDSSSDSGSRNSQRAPSLLHTRISHPLRCGAAGGPSVSGPGTHGQVPRTIAAAAAAAPSPSARHEEAGEEGMRLQALPEE